MLAAVHNFIPVFTSEAGLCLSADNWQEAKITTASYSLESLLYKPGYTMLKKIPDLGHYLAWPGKMMVLNAMMLISHKAEGYLLHSPYDGSKIKLTFAEFIALIQHLSPHAVLLPKNILQDYPKIWETWTDAIMPFVHVEDLKRQDIAQSHGVYFDYSSAGIIDASLAVLDQWSHVPRYLIGNFSPQLIWELGNGGIEFIETDEPAKAAMQGRVYSQAGEVDLTDKDTEMQFAVIDAQCSCPTCAQQLTKAYLHHLLQNTPLLCQRFLIQHNVFYVQSFHDNV